METEPTRETLSAFIDGELPPKEMERIAALLAERPDIGAWVRRQEALRADIKGAFSELMAAPQPARLVQAAKRTPISWRWHLGQFTAPRIWVPAGAALALGLVIGIALQPGSDFASRDGRMMAQGMLATALNDKLASDGYAGSGPRIGISFRSHDGRYCRTFDADAQSGLACRGDKGWAIALLVAHPQAESGGAYRMVGSEMPDTIRAAVSANIEGEPFDAGAERAARDRGWK
ncbi:MAG: anti-sigma factor [Pseudomonadota bacterium]